MSLVTRHPGRNDVWVCIEVRESRESVDLVIGLECGTKTSLTPLRTGKGGVRVSIEVHKPRG